MLVNKGMKKSFVAAIKRALGVDVSKLATMEIPKVGTETAEKISGKVSELNKKLSGEIETSPLEFQQLYEEVTGAASLQLDPIKTKAKAEAQSRALEKEMKDIMRRSDEILSQQNNLSIDTTPFRNKVISQLENLKSFSDTEQSVERAIELMKNADYKQAHLILTDLFVRNQYDTSAGQLYQTVLGNFQNKKDLDNILNRSVIEHNKSIFEKGKDGKSDFDRAMEARKVENDARIERGENGIEFEAEESEYGLKLYNDAIDRGLFVGERGVYTPQNKIQDLARANIEAEIYKKSIMPNVGDKPSDIYGNFGWKIKRKLSGFDLNLSDAYAIFKPIASAVSDEIKRIHNWANEIPILKARADIIDDLVINGYARLGTVDGKFDQIKNNESQLRVRDYIQSFMGLTPDQLGFIEIKDENGIVRRVKGNVEAYQKLNLNSEEVIVANKTINILNDSEKFIDYVDEGNYEAAKRIFQLSLQDYNIDLNLNSEFSKYSGYFPAKGNEKFNKMMDEIAAKEGNKSHIGYMNQRYKQILSDKHKDASFFRLSRKIWGSALVDNPDYRLLPVDELLAYKRGLDGSVTNRTRNMFDQLEMTQKLYDSAELFDKEDIEAMNNIIKDLRTQFEQLSSPKAMADNVFNKFFSRMASFEMTLALTNPKMLFANMFQGFDLSSATQGKYLSGYLKYLGSVAGSSKTYLSGKGKLGSFYEYHKSRENDSIIDAIASKYFYEHSESHINMADMNDMMNAMTPDSVRNSDYGSKYMKFWNKSADILTYAFRASEAIARDSTLRTTGNTFLEITKKMKKVAAENPEMTNKELLDMFSKELHINTMQDYISAESIVSKINDFGNGVRSFLESTGAGLDEISGKKLMSAAEEYAFANVRSQMFEYDAIRQSWLKSQLKSVSPYFAYPLAFKSWSFYFSSYMSGILNAAVNGGDKGPLAQFVAGSLIAYIGAGYAETVLNDKKYKKGKKTSFEKWFKQSMSSTAQYIRRRSPLFVPLDTLSMPFEEGFGVARPAYGIGLAAIYEAMDIAANAVTLGNVPFEIDEYAKREAIQSVKSEILIKKIRNFKTNMRELGLIDELKKKKKKKGKNIENKKSSVILEWLISDSED